MLDPLYKLDCAVFQRCDIPVGFWRAAGICSWATDQHQRVCTLTFPDSLKFLNIPLWSSNPCRYPPCNIVFFCLVPPVLPVLTDWWWMWSVLTLTGSRSVARSSGLDWIQPAMNWQETTRGWEIFSRSASKNEACLGPDSRMDVSNWDCRW